MISLGLAPGGVLRVLCLGAHSDDIEIGCGGTVLSLAESRRTAFHWVVLSSDESRRKEARAGARAFLKHAAERTVIVKGFRDGFFPYQGARIKEFFEELKRAVEPDVIFTHFRSDLHQDHRLVSELTWNTFRNHLILEYEIPKYDGDVGQPNVFVPLDEDVCRRKIALITGAFASQSGNQWFSEETFRATLRIRGIESNAPSGYAEAFYARKIILS